MTRMIRKQIYVEPEQETRLKERAQKSGISESELIREGIDRVLDTPIELPRNLKAWEEAKKFMLERMKMDVPQTGRTWTRDELYDERFSKFLN